MNALISLVISFVLMFTGMPALPEVPETMHTVTISDFSMKIGEDSFATDASIRIGYAPSANGIVLTAEVIGADGTSVPAAMSIDSEGMRVSFNDMSNVYMIGSAIIDEAMQLDEDSVAELAAQLSAVEPIIRFVGSLNNPEKAGAFALDVLNAIITTNTVETTEKSFEVEGIQLSGNEYKIHITANGVLKALEMLRKSNNQELTDALNLILAMIGAQSFEQLISEEESGYLPFVVNMAADSTGEKFYTSVALDTEGAENAPKFEMEIAVIDRAVTVRYALEMNMGETGDDIVYNYEAALIPVGEDSYDLSGNYHMEIGRSIYAEDDDSSELIKESATADMAITGKIIGELCSVGLEMNISQTGSENQLMNIGVKMEMNQAAVGENGVETQIRFDFTGLPEVDIVNVGVTITEDTAAYQDLFTGSVIMLDENTISSGKVQMKLISDLLGAASGVMDIMSDIIPEGFEFGNVFDVMNTELVDETIESNVYESDADANMEVSDAVYKTIDTNNCESLEEASEIFGRDLPALITPAGYEPDGITASEGWAYISYYDAVNSNFVSVTVYETDSEDVPDELTFIGYGDNEPVFEAIAPYGDDCKIDVFFNDMTREEAEALVASMGI